MSQDLVVITNPVAPSNVIASLAALSRPNPPFDVEATLDNRPSAPSDVVAIELFAPDNVQWVAVAVFPSVVSRC